MNKRFHILMYNYIHKPIHHTQIPKIPRAFTYEPVWQSSNHHIQIFRSCQIGKTLGKTSIISFPTTEGKLQHESTTDGGYYHCCLPPDVGEGALEYNMPITS